MEGPRDLSGAVKQGDVVRVDVGRFRSGATRGLFLNTLSLGVYPELVRGREHWAPRIGGWSAGVLAALRVLRADRHPLEAEVNGRVRPLWLLLAGSGTYHRTGIASGRRVDLADGRLDIRIVHGAAGRRYGCWRRRSRARSPSPGTLLAFDDEVIDVEGDLTLEEQPEALTVYRPLTESLITRQSIS